MCKFDFTMKKVSQFLFFATFTIIEAQEPDNLWTRTYVGNNNQYGDSVQQANDG